MSRRPTGRPTIARVTSMSSMSQSKPSSGSGRTSMMPMGGTKASSRGDDGPVAGPSRQIAAPETNINVVVRLRGRTPREVESTSPIVAKTEGALSKGIMIETTAHAASSLAGASVAASSAENTKTYSFDRVFGPEADQSMVFDQVAKGMLDEVLGGYNCTIFAYGQTGTGKTYTMQGDLELSPLSTPQDAGGIIPRVIHRLFALLEAKQNTDYVVKCSYVEIYNEELRDLLSHDYGQAGSSTQMKIYEDGKKGTTIQGVEEVGLQNLSHALKVLKKGCQRRQTAETKMNTESSRSHTVLTVTVHVKETGGGAHNEDIMRIGKFNLVDLAGSEAIGRSGATDKRAREAGMINQSLLTLGRVISALVEKGPHIPYRESKLTRLLQDSLGGRTKTCIVATVSPVRSNVEETLSTLDYAMRARSIRNRPELNSHLTKAGLLREYLSDIERLKGELIAAREKSGIYIPDEQWTEMTETRTRQASDLSDAQQRASSCQVELATKKRDFDELVDKMVITQEDLAKTRVAERQLGTMLQQTQGDLSVAKSRLEEELAVSEAYQRGEARVDQVAVNLRDMAVESVGDVEGLFDKLARKAKVFGNNADATTSFVGDLQGLSESLRLGLQHMQQAQADLGHQLEAQMAAHAERGQELSQHDVGTLETAFQSFSDLSNSLDELLKGGHVEVEEASTEIMKIRSEIQNSVQQWASKLNKRIAKLGDELLQSQKQHVEMVGSVLGSTADLVEAVITTAHEHVQAEKAASERSRQLAIDASNAEIARLRSQNASLSNMLSEEKSKTAKLRTDLVANLTNMIVSFTDAQDASWSTAVAKVQDENVVSLGQMEDFARNTEKVHAESSQRAERFEEELEMATTTSAKQRQVGKECLNDFARTFEESLTGYNKKLCSDAARSLASVDTQCEALGVTSTELSDRAKSRLQQQLDASQSIVDNVQSTHQASIERTQSTAATIEGLTSTLVQEHATSSAAFDERYSEASSNLDSLMDRTALFVDSEIQEDLSTGVTPKKKVWNVPTSWQRTEPREVLIAQMRKRQQQQTQGSSSSSRPRASITRLEELGAVNGTGETAQGSHSRTPSASSRGTLTTSSSSSTRHNSDQGSNTPVGHTRKTSSPAATSSPTIPAAIASIPVSQVDSQAQPQPPQVLVQPLRVVKNRPKVLANGGIGGTTGLKGSGKIVEEGLGGIPTSRSALSVLGESNVPRKGRR